ncbi:type IIL restriction-modification enzyme MmeI [Singulisphaera sp. Ch08]|uniref:site-specific DNA-methyltransferase (adenine-specific) n=1 Tax=Singulisphaera sp. Ch08 TaxID=3120278 RepID=A0AAU7CMA5_9BACT
MPSSRHHNEWLSLIEVSGPFLSVPVLERVLPQGLDAHDPDHSRLLKLAFEEWEDDQQGERPNPAIHREWVNFVLKQTLGLPDEVVVEGQDIPQTLRATIAEHGETLRPDVVVRNPEGVPDAGKARLLIQTYPPTQDLEKPLHGRHWKASPATRMMELLHATDTRLGLVTNGEHWMLVDAPKGETTGFASWYGNLWFEEPLTLRAFRTLLGVHRFFSAANDETLEAMLKESASNQQEVTDRLGYQVREAVEEIVRSLDRLDQGEGRQLLAGVPEASLYEAALTVMMRLVFLFSAEERGLLLLGDPLYDEHYAVSTLVAKLQEAADQHGEEVLERRHDAWVRLLSTFRAVYGGVRHERLKLLPYGGKLFDPDQFPFLEGRRPGTTWKDAPATPLPIDNRTVLHLLRSLQYLEMRGEARRLSFRALDIEQIGHVYEGLLDHTAKRATEPMLSLTAAKGDEPEVAVSELERLRDKGETDLLKFLANKDVTGRSESALKKALVSAVSGAATKTLLAACGNDEGLFNRVKPFWGLVRNDTFDRLVVIRKGSVFVTAGTDRRSSGTHYTPRILTEPIVQYTLEPLVYVGPAEGWPKEEWKLRSAKELLDLKICDMACGSGAFLVQVCRYLAERLVEAWEDAEKRHPGVPGITPEGKASTGAANERLIPKDTDERLAYARRIVAQRCLYGVDKNPLAVEMAKLSLWLLTLGKDKPFTFLDHAIRCGDSLVGVNAEQLKTFSLDGKGLGISLPNFLNMIPKIMEATRLLRVRLEKIADDTIGNIEEKQRLFDNIRSQTKRLNYAADRLLAASWGPAKPAERVALLRKALQEVNDRIRDVPPDTLEADGLADRKEAGCPRPFHWALEFPEVFLDRGGFDAFVCNPPFMGGQKISGHPSMGDSYREYLIENLAEGKRGSADLCAYFFLRAFGMLREGGHFGFLATNTVSQGDSRLTGLDQIVANGGVIYWATPSHVWPGAAAVYVAICLVCKGGWDGECVLDGKAAPSISALLDAEYRSANPCVLQSNANQSFKGIEVYGTGFLLSEEQALSLIRKNVRLKNVLRPYLDGQTVNSSPDLTTDRWVIDFTGLSLEEAMGYEECFRIVESLVKPQRLALASRNSSGISRAKLWWRFSREVKDLYDIIASMNRVLVVARVSRTLAFAYVDPNQVLNEMLVVFVSPRSSILSLLQSSLHAVWCWTYSSTLKGDLRYSQTDCFETFPLPSPSEELDLLGESYHEYRSDIMLSRQEGLTKTYNRFHAPDESVADIQKLRDLHVEMDKAVAAAYGWDDLDLCNGFHETKQGTRFTISESARQEVLARLLKLNHERYAEEVAQGLHDKKGKAKTPKAGRGRKSKASSGGATLFGDDEDDPDPADAPNNYPSSAPEREPTRADQRVQRPPAAEPTPRPTPIDQIETDAIMAAFRQAARGQGWLGRDELLKEVSLALGYQRLGPKIDESLRGHLRAAIRRRIIETDGPTLVRTGTATMADYEPDELLEVFRSVMRKGTRYDREEVIPALAHHLGFVRLTDSIQDPIRKAITRAIRHGLLGYEGSLIWRV